MKDVTQELTDSICEQIDRVLQPGCKVRYWALVGNVGDRLRWKALDLANGKKNEAANLLTLLRTTYSAALAKNPKPKT